MVRLFPQEPLDIWRSAPAAVVNRLANIWDWSPESAYYHDQLAALRLLRYWFGDVQVLALVERRGVEGEARRPPSLAGQQLALSIEAPSAQIDPPVNRQWLQRRTCAVAGHRTLPVDGLLGITPVWVIRRASHLQRRNRYAE